MPPGMFNPSKNSPEQENGFGHYVGLDDPTEVADSNIGKDVIYQTNNNMNGTDHKNDKMMNEITKKIEKSQAEVIQMMRSHFKSVLEGQNKINSKIDSLSQRIDKIEQMISSFNNNISGRSIDKSKKGIDLIRDHLKSDMIFQSCTETQINDLVKTFKAESFKADSVIFTEHDEANRFFIIEKGIVDVFQKSERVNELKEPSSFGEKALMDNVDNKYGMSLRARSDCSLWLLERKQFRSIMKPTNEVIGTGTGSAGKFDFLHKIKISGKIIKDILEPNIIQEMAQTCQRSTYNEGVVIARENEKIKAFYMIEKGTVNCYKKSFGANPISTLTVGDSFGVNKILDTTCIATSSVTCLCLLRKDFERFLEKTDVVNDITAGNSLTFNDATMDDFEIIKQLGIGNFSSVKLVRLRSSFYRRRNIPSKETSKIDTLFALKCFKNKNGADDGVDLKQMMQDEKEITSSMDSPFIIKYFGEINHASKTYFILEALLGGDLYKLLSEQKRFQDDWVRFYAASVLSAFTEIHSKHVAYRDLKPENLIIGSTGYIKLIDFGLAKKVENGKTFTCCGTLDYLSPEIILKTGHDMAVDYWALGILIYEMAAGTCPFIANDQIKTCQRILAGRIDMPLHFSPSLSQIIKAFLEKDPTKRLGKDDAIKTHQWFDGLNWVYLLKKKMRAPYKPSCAIENQRLKISAPSNVSSIVGQVNQQTSIISKLSNLETSKRHISHHQDTDSDTYCDKSLSKNKHSLAGKARNLKASMFGGYY